MFEQLSSLMKQFGNEAVINNPAVPNEHNEAVLGEASNSIVNNLKEMIANGNISDVASLFNNDNASDSSNPVVQQLTEKLSGNLGEKFGLSNDVSSDVAGGLIPKVLGSLIGKAKDPNDSSINVSDIIGSLTSGNSEASGGLMDAVSKYGSSFGLDQNGDGKVGMDDAIAAVSNKSRGLGGLLGKLFGK